MNLESFFKFGLPDHKKISFLNPFWLNFRQNRIEKILLICIITLVQNYKILKTLRPNTTFLTNVLLFYHCHKIFLESTFILLRAALSDKWFSSPLSFPLQNNMKLYCKLRMHNTVVWFAYYLLLTKYEHAIGPLNKDDIYVPFYKLFFNGVQAMCLPLGASVSLLIMFFFFDSMQVRRKWSFYPLHREEKD